MALPADIRSRANCERLVADAVRQLGGLDILVNNAAYQQSKADISEISDEQMVDDMRVLGRDEGVSAAPEGAATLSAVRKLVADGLIQQHETVVIFNTGGALKYLDVLR